MNPQNLFSSGSRPPAQPATFDPSVPPPQFINPLFTKNPPTFPMVGYTMPSTFAVDKQQVECPRPSGNIHVNPNVFPEMRPQAPNFQGIPLPPGYGAVSTSSVVWYPPPTNAPPPPPPPPRRTHAPPPPPPSPVKKQERPMSSLQHSGRDRRDHRDQSDRTNHRLDREHGHDRRSRDESLPMKPHKRSRSSPDIEISHHPRGERVRNRMEFSPSRSDRRNRDKDISRNRDNDRSHVRNDRANYTETRDKNRIDEGVDRKKVRDARDMEEIRTRREKQRQEEEENSIPETTDDLINMNVTWTRTYPAEPYYELNNGLTQASDRLKDIQSLAKNRLLGRNLAERASRTPFQFPERKRPRPHVCSRVALDDSSCDSNSEDESKELEEDVSFAIDQLNLKRTHPWRLHEDLWYNDLGEMNDGPLCRCSHKSRTAGIRHGFYPGEESLPTCDPITNNLGHLFHYRITLCPLTNFTTKYPTTIKYQKHVYTFEGFSLLSHHKLDKYPSCKLIRFNIEYTLDVVEDPFPTNFSVRDLDSITDYIFEELLELVDLKWRVEPESCPIFHLFPRFSRIDDDGKELLSPAIILNHLITSYEPLIDEEKVGEMTSDQWDMFARSVKGMIAVKPGSKPCAIRIDQIDRHSSEDFKDDIATKNKNSHPDHHGSGEVSVEEPKLNPVIVHFGIRPPQLSYAGNPDYQRAWRECVKFRHLLSNKPKVTAGDRQDLGDKEERVHKLRSNSDLKRDVTVEISTKGFNKTGLFCDVFQHALMVPVIVCHLRFHQSLKKLEETLEYKFTDRYLLQLALTHPSYRENFGTNPDHARNSLTNCGIRQALYGDKRVHYQHTRKRGINMLVDIMSRKGRDHETVSSIHHNERLEFLGDAVVEFISSIHLYFMFPNNEEGALATFRATVVQNQHLTILARKWQLDKYMLYAHGSDLCHDSELKHAMANCFEALMGAIYLDGGIAQADRIFSNTFFGDKGDILYQYWYNPPLHPLQSAEPNGDRHYIDKFARLKELTEFEEMTGFQFTHIRLLARAFTHRSCAQNLLTGGSNQRMEFLGDTVLQLITSDYLYRHFPDHHEGHLSLLRSSLVNNKTQSVVCDDLDIPRFAAFNYPKGEMKTKDRADLLEAFMGALFVDKGLEPCTLFCQVCFFPRLEEFILNQDWNDPKSKLQQCCLTLRTHDGGEPDIPEYKVVNAVGPTNTRKYEVSVKFRGKRLATGHGQSIQDAEMAAASNALSESKDLFPQLSHQEKVIERTKWNRSDREREKRPRRNNDRKDSDRDRQKDRGHKDRDRERMKERSRKES